MEELGEARLERLEMWRSLLQPRVQQRLEVDARVQRHVHHRAARDGGRRGGGHDEYVQTINQLLSELDGFHGAQDGIVVVAATNRSQAVDPALLRPGRFDRHVLVELPDAEERRDILRLYCAKHAGESAERDEARATPAASEETLYA